MAGRTTRNPRRGNGYSREFTYDQFVPATTVIDGSHRMVHDGYFFQTSGKQTGFINGADKHFFINVPARCYPHIQTMVLNFGRGDIDFVAFENPTVSAVGTPITAMNVNRGSDNTPDLELYAEPTVTDDGTNIFTLWAPPTGTGTGQSANGIAGVGQAGEWLLKPSNTYLIRLTNNSGATIDWSYEFSWYEPGDDI